MFPVIYFSIYCTAIWVFLFFFTRHCLKHFSYTLFKPKVLNEVPSVIWRGENKIVITWFVSIKTYSHTAFLIFHHIQNFNHHRTLLHRSSSFYSPSLSGYPSLFPFGLLSLVFLCHPFIFPCNMLRTEDD